MTRGVLLALRMESVPRHGHAAQLLPVGDGHPPGPSFLMPEVGSGFQPPARELVLTAISVGPAAENRAAAAPANFTHLDLGNAADGSGTIDTVTVYAATNMTNAKIGIFYLVSGTTYKCRSSYTAGSLAAGLNTLTGLSLAINSGDFIGMYWGASGTLDRTDTGGTSANVAGDYADVDDQASYSTGTRIYSIHGAGTTTAVGNPFYAYAQQ